jgi:hypothetical protein
VGREGKGKEGEGGREKERRAGERGGGPTRKQYGRHEGDLVVNCVCFRPAESCTCTNGPSAIPHGYPLVVVGGGGGW